MVIPETKIPIDKLKGIGKQTAQNLQKAGVMDLVALSEARNLQEIKKATGYSMKNLNKWQQRAQDYVKKAKKKGLLPEEGAPATPEVEDPNQETSTEESDSGAIVPETSSEIKDPQLESMVNEMKDLELGMKIANAKVGIALGIQPSPEELQAIADLVWDESRMVHGEPIMKPNDEGPLVDPLAANLDNITVEISSDVKTSLQDDEVSQTLSHSGSATSEGGISNVETLSDESISNVETLDQPSKVYEVNQTYQIDRQKEVRFPGNPRIEAESTIEELLEDIKTNGIQAAVIASPLEPYEVFEQDGKQFVRCFDTTMFEVIDGERRRTCANLLELPTIPTKIELYQNEQEKWGRAFKLNSTIKSFTDLETGFILYNRKTTFLETDEEVGAAASMSANSAKSYMSLVLLPPAAQKLNQEGQLRKVAATEIARLSTLDIHFPRNLGKPIKEAVKEGIVWDFDRSQETEYWAEKRVELQTRLAEESASGKITLTRLRNDITYYIENELSRRHKVEEAEKKAAEEAERERTRKEEKKTSLKATIAHIQEQLDKAIPEYIEVCKAFKKQHGDLGVLDLKDPKNYEQIVDLTFFSFDQVFGPLISALPENKGLKLALDTLKVFDETDVFKFEEKDRCRHCGAEIDSDTRAILIESLQKEIDDRKVKKDGIEDLRDQLKDKQKKISSNYKELKEAESNLAYLEKETPPESGETDLSQMTEEDLADAVQDNVNVTEISEKTSALFFRDTSSSSRIGCIGCGLEIEEGEEYDEWAATDSEGMPSTFYGHKKCSDTIEAEDFDLFEAEKALKSAPQEICPLCDGPILPDQEVEKIAAGPDEGKKIHKTCPQPETFEVKSEVHNEPA